MTEPFKTPEPSDAAWYAAEKAMEGCPQDESPSRHAIAAGMAIDLPALCRKEIREALKRYCHPELLASAMEWCEKRYGQG